jgi:hypothetical protein
MIYAIYHPSVNEYTINHECKVPLYKYKHVYSVDADSMEEAFRKAQNDFNPEYEALGIRSTSVGDVIQSIVDFEWAVCHVVTGKGFMQRPDVEWLYSFQEAEDFIRNMEDLKNECDLNGLENQSPE